MPVCGACGAENKADAAACTRCGAPLGDAPPADDDTLILRLLGAEPQQAVGPRRARIWLLDPSGQQVDRALDLAAEATIIGRRDDCTIVLPSNTVSRRHAEIRRDGERWLLSDLGSTNGTLLNGEPVIGAEPLADRDEIGVGIYRLIFRLT